MAEKSKYTLRQPATGLKPSYNTKGIVNVDPTKPLVPRTQYFYPKPLADYEEVVADSGLFHSTLDKFHSAMGSTLRCPSLGGINLDLRKLFLEVTRYGGAGKIHDDDNWKAVAAVVFKGNLPSFTENFLLELRKYYASLLYHYEQVYFARKDYFMILPKGTSGLEHAAAIVTLRFAGKRKYEQMEKVNDESKHSKTSVNVDPTQPLVPGTKYFYPKPLVDYEKVVADSGLFHSTLKEFHSAFGSTLRYPSLGGTPLDLHKLFLEVTRSGGAGMINSDDKWKAVTAAVFEGNLPSFVENVHVELRKYYVSLLYHYEQVYFASNDAFMILPEGSFGPELGTAIATYRLKHRQPSHGAKTVVNVDPTQPPVSGYNYLYPKPLAEYKEVVADSGLFYSTLKEFLSAMGTPLRYPSLGGKALDLHKLFLVVTEVGGADKIYGPEEWKAVAAAVFEGGSPSFVENDDVHVELRKHYLSLLYHYERVYFYGADIFRMMPAGCDPEHMIPIAAIKLCHVIPRALEFAEGTITPEDGEEKEVADGGKRSS